jgi:hypothetical protein
MLDQKQVTAGGTVYTIQTLPTSLALQAVAKIGHLIAGMSEGFGFTAEGVETMPINYAAVVAGVLKRVDSEQTPAFIKKLVLDSVMPKMPSDVYESVFAGNFEALWELIEAIIDHNHFVEAIKKKTRSDHWALICGWRGVPGEIHPIYLRPLVARLASLDEMQSRLTLWEVVALNEIVDAMTPRNDE